MSRKRRKRRSINRPKSHAYLAEVLEDRLLLSAAAVRHAAAPGASITLSPAATTPVAPHVVSINRSSPTGLTTAASTVDFLATFSQAVTGVDATDFSVTADPSVKYSTPLVVTQVTTSTYDVAVNGIRGSGDLQVNLHDDHTIVNSAGQHLAPSNATDMFQQQQNFSSLGIDGQVIARDLNGDGITDLVGNHNNQVAVYFGTGNGNYTFKQYLSGTTLTGGVGSSIAVGDFNNDGRPDIAVQTPGSGENIYLASSTYTYLVSQTLPDVGRSVISTVDMNHDGIQDLFAVPMSGSYIFYWLGNSNGSFQAAKQVSLGSYTSVSAVDVNGDNNADLIVSNSGGIDIYFNNGSAGFPTATHITNSGASAPALAADLNNDGKVDLAIENNFGAVLMLAGNGNGTFSTTATTLFTGAGGDGLYALDVNQDGVPDLVTNGINDFSVGVALNDGSGHFKPLYVLSSTLQTVMPSVADLNGDGRQDLVLPYDTSSTSALQYFLEVPRVGATSQPYVISQPAPHVVTFVPTSSAPPAVNATSLDFTVTFSAPVTGVDPTDFHAITTGGITTGPITVTTVSSTVYRVTIAGIHGGGNVSAQLLDDGSIRDALGTRLANPATATFAPSTAIPTQYSIVAVNDFNRDGIPDVLTNFGGNVYLFIGSGGGTFGAPRLILSTATAYCVGDLNNDGKLDVVAQAGTILEYLPGNGAGGFGAPVASTISATPITVADFNNDGNADLLAYASGGVTVIFGPGFNTSASITGLQIYSNSSVTVRDVNGDGALDILATQTGYPVAFGRGDGTFYPATTYSNFALGFADFNTDGLLDEVVNSGGVGQAFGNSGGTFGTPTILNLPDNSSYFGIGDWNGDGLPDVVGNFDRPIYLDGPSGFTFVSSDFNSFYTAPIVVGDINGDGKPDFVSAGFAPMLNTDTDSFSSQPVTIIQTAPRLLSVAKSATQPGGGAIAYTVTFSQAVTGVAAGAFSVSTTGTVTAGAPTLAGSGAAYTVTVPTVAGTGTIALNFTDNGAVRGVVGLAMDSSVPAAGLAPATLPGITTSYMLAAADFNRDGKSDLLTIYQGVLNISLGNGNGTFQTPWLWGIGGGSVAVGDVNADGIPDVVIGPTPQIGIGQGDGTFSFSQPNIPNAYDLSQVTLADVNGDGALDIVAFKPQEKQIAVSFGDNHGDFAQPVFTSLAQAPTSMAVGDVNRDGIPDVLVTLADGSVKLLLGATNGTFAVPTTSLATVGSTAAAVLTDLNGDGKLDLVVGSGTTLHTRLGNGDGTFQPEQQTTVDSVAGLAAADLNGDGFADIVVSPGASTFQSAVLLGTSAGTFESPVKFGPTGITLPAAIADFTGDGRPDVVLAGDTSTLLSSSAVGTVLGAPSVVGTALNQDSVGLSASQTNVILAEDADGTHLDWTIGGVVGQTLISDPAGLTFTGITPTTIQFSYAGGNPLPSVLHLNGTFTLSGLAGADPMAGRTVDIGKSTVYLTYSGTSADPLAAVRNYLRGGYNAGAWNGAATAAAGVILSSAAASDANHATGIGYADSADGLVPLPANTIELKYTLYGDTGLAGTVGFTDFMRMTQHYTLTGITWGKGDFNYDGTVGSADFNLLQPNYGQTLPAPAPAMTPIFTAPVTSAPPPIVDALPASSTDHSTDRAASPTRSSNSNKSKKHPAKVAKKQR